MSELLDIKDLAARYRVSPITIRRWCRNGTLPKPDLVRGAKRFWRRTRLEGDEGERRQVTGDRRREQGT